MVNRLKLVHYEEGCVEVGYGGENAGISLGGIPFFKKLIGASSPDTDSLHIIDKYIGA